MKNHKLKIVLLLALLFISSLSLYATENEVAVLPDLVRFVKEMGSYSFEEKSYTSTDALVFARLSYEPFQLLPEKETPYTIEEASAYLLNFPLFSKLVLIEWDDELLSACASSIRYKDVKILEFVSDTNNEEDKQFSAVTFSLSNGLLFLSFRGTDNTLVGWKEDFNMSFTSPVPSQEEAVKYTEKIASLYSGTLILTGHSKGGNIAKYAASFASIEVQERIREIWAFDAPGFPDSILNSEGYKRVRERIRVFVPESSIIGMLLSNDLNYVSVKSRAFTGLSQHDVYTWEIGSNGRFILSDSIDRQSRYVDATIRRQLSAMPKEERAELVDLLFSLFETTGKKTFASIREDFFSSALKIIGGYTDLNEEDKTKIKESISSFLSVAFSNIGILFTGEN